MDTQVVKLIEMNRLSKIFQLAFIIGILVFLIVVESNTSRLEIFNLTSFGIVYLILLISRDLIGIRKKIIIYPHKVIRKNGFWTSAIPISAICAVEADIMKGSPSYLVIKTDRSMYRMGQELNKMQITEAVVCIFEQIRLHYPENLAKINPDKKKKEQEALAEFWRN